MDDAKIQTLLATIKAGILGLNETQYGAPGTVTEKQADERARNIAQAIIGEFELVEVLP